MNEPLLGTPWADATETVIANHTTDADQGMDAAEVTERQQRYGRNQIKTETKPSPLRILLRQFKSPLILILCAAIVLTASLSEWLDAGIIAFAVLVNAVLGFFQEWRAEQALMSLGSYVENRARVIRNGRERDIDAAELVPGDLVRITSGSRISADIRIIKSIDAKSDEAVLTGESLPVTKTVAALAADAPLADRTNMLYAGTLAVSGSSLGIVTATGARTEIGKLAALVQDTKNQLTPLQRAMGRLTWVIIIVTTILVSAVFYIGLRQGQEFYEMLVLSVAVLVGSVPEALPIGLTAILAIGVERIAKRRGIIRNLTASETLGSTTLIITDKTGTLTEAKLELRDIDTVATLQATDFTLRDQISDYATPQRDILRLALAATDVIIENPDAAPADWRLTGDDLEGNIVKASAAHGIDPHTAAATPVVVPFSSKHKFSVSKLPKQFIESLPSASHVVLGAPDVLVARSQLSTTQQANITNALQLHSTSGKRIIGVGILRTAVDGDPDHIDDIEFLGILSFYDPIRAEVPESLRQIASYGTHVVMATGDLPGTALFIARQIGWNVDESHVMSGAAVSELSDDELNARLDHVRIFARVTPRDKLRLVRLFQERRNHIVAMTGDGVNDAPSLKAANIGIAVGSGTDVAKSVADLVLLDDNFSTIVATIEEGKQILSNIKKMFVYLMSNALDELILVGGAIIAGVALPLTAVQIIWVNLFTGSIPAIAYAFDRLMMRETDQTARTLFDPRVIFLTISVGVVISGLLLTLYLTMLGRGVDLAMARTVLFAAFGFYTLLIAYSFLDLSRPLWRYRFWQNKMLNVGFVVGSSLMLLTLYLPFFQTQFEITTLSTEWAMFVAVWLVLQVVVVELLKAGANRWLVKY
jgi:magnesium-transporting ATPase (P-type)